MVYGDLSPADYQFVPILFRGRGKSDDAPGHTSATPESREDASLAPEEMVRCASCHHGVTADRFSLPVNGQAQHRFVNPAGIYFDIHCFSQAPGALSQGTPENYWTWFAGYAWQMSTCTACTVHLGWKFLAAEDAFYGLIVNRLTWPN